MAVRNLRKYATSTHALGVAGGIAVNCMQETILAVVREAEPDADIQVLHVPVWGAFVPALNTLLGEAQRRRCKFILYQSLEVACHPAILKKLLDYHTTETLVVGPVLDGHIFMDGRQILNGRTSPWNTLALWSTRKLGLSGFLNVAEGLPGKGAVDRQISGYSAEPEEGSPAAPAMGSEDWWTGRASQGLNFRQCTDFGDVPAGVEEVTAIALLQHLIGEDNARAVLVDLPKSLESKVTWKTNWDGDEKRRQWHEHKMNTKIARPAAQIRQLFRKVKKSSEPAPLLQDLLPRLGTGSPQGGTPVGAAGQEQQADEKQLAFGVVHHFGEFISPPMQVERICMFSYALFMANFSSSFAEAFKIINSGHPCSAMPTLTAGATAGVVCLMISGVYIPMPVSLVFIRWLSLVGGHKLALLCFAGVMMFTHIAVALVELAHGEEGMIQMLLILVRLLEGLGGAVLFQTRFILLQSSTQEQHAKLQATTFLAGDLGLGIGALLPYLCSLVVGQGSINRLPDILASFSLSAASFVLLLWLASSFPKDLYRLSHRIRFPASAEEAVSEDAGSPSSSHVSMLEVEQEDAQRLENERLGHQNRVGHRVIRQVLGTLRVFVQSAAIMSIAVYMRDLGFVGHFRQSLAVSIICLFPVPFEGFVAGVWFKNRFPTLKANARNASFAILASAAIFSVVIAWWFSSGELSKGQHSAIFLAELVSLTTCLAFAVPTKVLKLEQDLVLLEWSKAYLGRIGGPVVTLVVHHVFGPGPMLGLLFVATTLVAVAA